MTLDQKVEKLAKDLDILDHHIMILKEAAMHPWACKCSVCKEFWKLMPPDEDGMFGPFSPSELRSKGQDNETL